MLQHVLHHERHIIRKTKSRCAIKFEKIALVDIHEQNYLSNHVIRWCLKIIFLANRKCLCYVLLYSRRIILWWHPYTYSLLRSSFLLSPIFCSFSPLDRVYNRMFFMKTMRLMIWRSRIKRDSIRANTSSLKIVIHMRFIGYPKRREQEKENR